MLSSVKFGLIQHSQLAPGVAYFDTWPWTGIRVIRELKGKPFLYTNGGTWLSQPVIEDRYFLSDDGKSAIRASEGVYHEIGFDPDTQSKHFLSPVQVKEVDGGRKLILNA